MKGRRCTAFNRFYVSELAKKILRTISEEINVKSIISADTEFYVNCMNKEGNSKEKEYSSNSDDYRIFIEKKEKCKKSNQQTTHSYEIRRIYFDRCFDGLCCKKFIPFSDVG